MLFGVGHAYSSDLGTSVSQGAFPAAETRRGVDTRDARIAGVKLALRITEKMPLVADAYSKFSTSSENLISHLIHVIALHPVSCESIWAGGALKTP